MLIPICFRKTHLLFYTLLVLASPLCWHLEVLRTIRIKSENELHMRMRQSPWFYAKVVRPFSPQLHLFQTWTVLLRLSWFLSSPSSFPAVAENAVWFEDAVVFYRWIAPTLPCSMSILWCRPLLRNQATEITSKTLVTVTMATMKWR